MKGLILATVALLAAISGFMVFRGISSTQRFSHVEITRYNQWRSKFNRLYATPSEGQFRMDVVINKIRMVDSWNQEYEEFLSNNDLTSVTEPMFVSMPWDDLTTEEFKKAKTGLNPELRVGDEIESGLGYELKQQKSEGLGQAKPYEHKIRNQGECGSCWAFSTIATLEKQYYNSKKVQIDLSHQELVDCSDQDSGCDGGWPTNTYSYIQNNGIQNAATYPYYGNQYYCDRDESKRIWFDSSFAAKEIAFTTTSALNAANNGIVAGTCVHSALKFNNLGASPDIYNAAASGECAKQVDHAVNIQSSGKDEKGAVSARF